MRLAKAPACPQWPRPFWAGGGLICLLLLAVPGSRAQPPPTSPEAVQETIDKCLVELASQEVDARRRALLVLGKYDDPRARQAVAQALSDPDARLRLSALVAITERFTGQEGGRLLTMVGDPDVHVRRMASSLLPQLLSVMRNFTVPQNFGEPAPLLAPEHLRVVLGALSDEDATVRVNALRVLPMLRRAIPADVLPKLLQAPEAEVRLAALNAALAVLPPAELAEVAGHLATDSERRIRLRLAQGLGQARGRAAEKALRTLLAEPDLEISTEALLALFRQDPGEWRATVRERLAMDGLSAALGQSLIQHLPLLGKEAPETLHALLAHPRPVYRAAALETMADGWPESLGREVLLPLLADTSAEVRAIVLLLLRGQGTLTLKDLQGLLSSPYLDLRRALPELARPLTAEAAGELLMDLVLDDDVAVRAKALREFGTRRLPGWQKLLRQALRDPENEIVTAALEGLGRSAHPEALPMLAEFIAQAPTPTLRALAQQQHNMLQFQLRAPDRLPMGPRR